MKRGNTLELLALLAIILIPIGFVLYALFGTSGTTPTVPAAAATQQPTHSNTAPKFLSSATISLDNASALPTSIPANQFVPFSFTIANTGSQSGQIPYKVSVKWSTGEQDVIDTNVVTLQAGASQTVQEDLKFEIATETARVSLQLPTIDQGIQFTLPEGK